jgi:peroxiredoxin
MRTLCFVVALLAAAAQSVSALQQAAAERIEVQKLGPQEGQVIPDFRLPDAQGRVWTRDALMGPNGLMLVFSRSMDWCPYCKTQAIELQDQLEQIRSRGLGLAVITYDSPAILADFVKRRGITFPLLSDEESRTIRAYGIFNTTVAEETNSYGIPFPGTFLVDRNGRVTSRFFEDAYQERNTVSTIMVALGVGTAPAAARRITTDHLEVTAYLSDDVIAPGSLFSLVMDVQPKPGMHVYAPGAASYRVIEFKMSASPLLLVRPLQYPASEIYHFVPLNERVPVFQKPFRLVQTMAISTAQDQRTAVRALETLTISGMLEYQACDDRICYTPQSIPVSYEVKVRQLDSERANAPR